MYDRVADTANHMIRKISTSGNVTTVTGTGRMGYLNGTLAQAQFRFPSAIAVARDGTYFFVAGNAGSYFLLNILSCVAPDRFGVG
jgi:hypothetical protein